MNRHKILYLIVRLYGIMIRLKVREENSMLELIHSFQFKQWHLFPPMELHILINYSANYLKFFKSRWTKDVINFIYPRILNCFWDISRKIKRSCYYDKLWFDEILTGWNDNDFISNNLLVRRRNQLTFVVPWLTSDFWFFLLLDAW